MYSRKFDLTIRYADSRDIFLAKSGDVYTMGDYVPTHLKGILAILRKCHKSTYPLSITVVEGTYEIKIKSVK